MSPAGVMAVRAKPQHAETYPPKMRRFQVFHSKLVLIAVAAVLVALSLGYFGGGFLPDGFRW